MRVDFRIEYVFENLKRKDSPHLFARMLTESEILTLTDSSTLGGVPVKRFDKPRSTKYSLEGNSDYYSFDLKDRSHASKFEKGQIVSFIS